MKVILDPGHGGIDDNGVYTTAPNKMHTFDDGVIAYEGVLNRQIAEKIGNYLTNKGITVLYTVLPLDAYDLPLNERVEFANRFDSNEVIFVSLHSNASSSHNARGFEIFTSVGQTKSDKLATCIGDKIMEEFDDLRYRADYGDGDSDKEAQFYVLRKTKCVAVLVENLFFDNRQDFDLLCAQTFQKRLSEQISKGIIQYIENI